MDKILPYIKEHIELYRKQDQYSLLKHIATYSGNFWTEDDLEPWEREVHYPEFELLSAFEFLRPELPPEQTAILDGWIAKYAKWRDEGIFYQRYQESWGSRFTWEDARKDAEEDLGRLIPRSHWWWWPPEKARKK
jgi:hypothetical protein